MKPNYRNPFYDLSQVCNNDMTVLTCFLFLLIKNYKNLVAVFNQKINSLGVSLKDKFYCNIYHYLKTLLIRKLYFKQTNFFSRMALIYKYPLMNYSDILIRFLAIIAFIYTKIKFLCINTIVISIVSDQGFFVQTLELPVITSTYRETLVYLMSFKFILIFFM